MSKKGRPIILSCVIAPVVLWVGGSLTIDHIDQNFSKFFGAGKMIVEDLDRMAKRLAARQPEGLEEFYSEGFKGQRLGLATLVLAVEKDGVKRLLWKSDGAQINRNEALAEWRDYLAGFDSIEEAAIYLHRLEKWDSPSERVAVIRFELIGTPRGARQSGIDRGFIRMHFDVVGNHVRIRSSSTVEGDRLISDVPHFTDVSAVAGVNFENRYYPAFLNQPLKFGMIRYGPAGITAADYDNDGFYDLFIPDGVESKLLRNKGDGAFEDVTAETGLAGLDGVGVGLFADYDNDGYKDFFVSRTFRHNQLFHNNRNGTFTDVTEKSGIGEDNCTTVASWADYDNDGYLDLYVGRYIDPRKDIPTGFYARNGDPDQLYHNNGNGTFTNVTEKAGVGEPGLCLGSVFGDYDDDGYPDLFVVNDFGRNTLYHNNRNGTFTDVTVKSGSLNYGAGMSGSFADYDNDGKLDIYVTNIRSEHAWFAEAPTVAEYMITFMRQGVWRTDMAPHAEIFRQSGLSFVKVFQQMASGNALLRNRGDGTFENVTARTRANPPGWFWGASFADFDNDGWQDIYSADGWVRNEKGPDMELEFLTNVVTQQKEYKTGKFFDPAYFGRRSWHGWERNRMLYSTGKGDFVEVGRATGTDLVLNSRGIAVADFWNRGALDIAVAASTDRHALLKNDVAQRRNWLAVELVGTKSNRDAVGARVTIRVRGKQQMREVVLGDGYGSQNTLRLYFGLDGSVSADELTVKWPRSGLVQKFQNVAANRIVEITEGKEQFQEKRYAGGFQ